MPRFPRPEVDLPGGPVGLLDRIAFALFAVIGAALGGASAAATAWMQGVREHALRSVPNTPLGPSELAVGLVKNVGDAAELYDEALSSGIGPERLHFLEQITGNPPGPETLLRRWRWGAINTETFRHGLVSGYLKNEWIGFFEGMRHEPLSAETYVRGAVEGDIDYGKAQEIAGRLGMSGEDFDLLFRIMGNPPGLVEALKLWKRGRITRERVVEIIKDSHYKNKYTEELLAYGDYYPPVRTISTLLRNGAVSVAQAKEWWIGNGLSEEMATAYAKAATATKTAKERDLTVSQLATAYTEKIIPKADVVAQLVDMGYDVGEADLILELADARAKAKFRTEAINGVKRVFLAGRMTDAAAREALTRFDIPAEQQTELIELWKVQRLAPSETLTVAQLGAAYKESIITEAEYKRRVIDHGYSPADADILALIVKDTRPATLRSPPA